MTPAELAILFSPSFTGFLTSSQCNVGEKSGKKLKFRPPGYVFGLVWPVLYLSVGYSFVIATRQTPYAYIYYILLNLLLNVWIIVYGCMGKKREATWVLLLCVLVSLVCYTEGNITNKRLLIPLMTWLGFATLMNAVEVQVEEDEL